MAETPSPLNADNHQGGWRTGVESPLHIRVTPKRRSSMLGRVSLGLQDALGWLNKQGSLLKSGSKSNVVSDSSVVVSRKTLAFGDMSTPAKAAKSNSERIFTITENQEDDEIDNDVKDILNEIRDAHSGPLMTPGLEETFSKKLKLHGEEDCLRTPNLSKLSSLPPLQQLLTLCGQHSAVDSIVTMEELLGKYVDLSTVRKVGEGTFGEAFRAGDVVFKIVPMEGTDLITGEPQKSAEEILGEAAVTMTLSKLRYDGAAHVHAKPENVTSGFVETHGIGVCKGRYSEKLSKEWQRWNKLYASENEPVDGYGEDQLYVVFVVANGGIDLEAFKPRSFDEIKSILMQVSLTLAVAENACEFEHRDLHWGNILINRDGTKHIQYSLRGVDITLACAGVRVTLIDFTLSRLKSKDGEIAYCNLSADPEIFNGPDGDPQAEAYRQMQGSISEWKDYLPKTNAIWLHYLTNIILNYKCPANCKKQDKEQLRALLEDSKDADSAESIVWHGMFSGIWSSSD